MPKDTTPRPCVDVLAGSAAVVGPLLLYVITMPRVVALEDDGLFLLVGKYLGVGHPPGYPVHTLLSNVFLKIPWGTEAFLGHLLSGVLGALACGAVYACIRLAGAGVGPIPALVGAWLFGATEHYWAQAIITEVYTLNALFFFVVFALLLHLRRDPGDDRAWIALAFVYGLSLANHWPLMSLATPGLLLALLPLWREAQRRFWRLAAVSIPAAVVPYIWMAVRSAQEPTFSFPGPLNTFDRLWNHIARSGYSEVDSSVSAGWSDRFEFLWWFATDLWRQASPFGLLLALVGVGAVVWRPQTCQVNGPKRRRKPAMRRSRTVERSARWAGPAVFLSQSAALILLLDFDFDYQHVYVFRAYPSVSYGLLGIWVAIGLHQVGSWVFARIGAPKSARSAATAAAGAVLVAWSVLAHWETNNRSEADFAQRYSEMIFEILPDDAVLITFGDEIVLPLAYNHFIEGLRPDVRYAEAHGIMFPGNLYRSIAETPVENQQYALQRFLDATDRPVFHTYRTNRVGHGRAVRDYGFVREVLDDGDPSETIQLRPDETAAEYFRHIVAQRDLDGWERVARSHQVIDYGQFLGYALLSRDEALIGETSASREAAEQDYYALNGMAGVLARFGDDGQLEQAMEYLQTAMSMHNEALSKLAEAEIYNNMGIVRLRQGRNEEAIELFDTSRSVFDDPGNPGVGFLARITAPQPVEDQPEPTGE